MSVLPMIEKTVVMIAPDITRPSDREVIQSKLMRNVILMILLTDRMAKYDTKATLDREQMRRETTRYQPWLGHRTVASNEPEPPGGRPAPRPGSFSPARR